MPARPPATARATLSPLASPKALSWTVLAIFAPVEFVVMVLANAAASGGSLGLWAVAFLAGLAVVVGVLLGARAVALRRGRASLVLVIGAYFLATLLQAPVFAITAARLGALSDLQITFRLAAPLIQVPLLMLVGLAVTSHAAHRRVIGELEQNRRRLLQLGPSLDTELDRLQRELAGAVRASLEPALSSLDVALTTAARGGARDAALDAIDAIVEDQVRPLSQKLVADDTVSDAEAITLVSGTSARVPLPQRFVVARGVLPVLASVAIALAATPTTIRDLRPGQGVAFLLALAVGCWVLLWSARRAMGDREMRTPLGIAAIVALHMVAFPVVLWALNAAGLATPRAIAAPGSVFLGAIGALIVSGMLVSERRAESEAALAEATERLERAVALSLRRQRLVRRRLAFVLHGSLQGALYAAALRVGEGVAVDAALVDEVRADVTSALAQLDAPRRAGRGCRLRAALDELAAVWHGARRVVATVAPNVEDVLRGDADADEAVAEVVREAVNNAFRHGAATRVSVDVAPGDTVAGALPSRIVISVRDDGCGEAGDAQPGVGSALFDDLCVAWDRTAGSGGSTMHAEVAVAVFA